ncbi:hypothetical protein DPMN_187796 [Dreissena polymorpha]|uniref:Fibronectin type-III domain-containing protein n=1 Tax=Dreissena polymorpha TaxID=45954 RepID=A0A9D4DRA1_DREPO|nr:hypothetical protein DPMN_187796 [Dreissena polymorpha]
MPIYRPQLYEVTGDSVKLSWQPVHVPEGASRISIRYVALFDLGPRDWFADKKFFTTTLP